MRILFITASYLPTANGVTYHISSTAEALRKLGHVVYILAPTFPGYKDLDKHVVRYPSLPNPFIQKYPLGIPLVSIDKIKKLRPDIIHTHHPLIIGQFASSVAEKLGKPLFATAHTQYEQYLNYYFPNGYNLTSSIIINDLKNLSQASNCIICPSINTQKRLLKHKIKNTVVANNGVEKNFFVKPRQKSTVVPTLVYTGRLDREKNPLKLIGYAKEIRKLIPNFKLLVIGGGDKFNEMFELTQKMKLEENVIYIGEIDRLHLPKIYRSAHLFITPSISEVMPISILEAMASGLPVLAVKKSGLEEIVVDNKSGFIVNDDPKIIAQKVKALLSNQQNLFELSQNTYKFALNFSSLKTAKRLIEVYKKYSHF